MSAESQLAGWFPINQSVFNVTCPITRPVWLPIPVHTVPTSEDSLLRPYDHGSCPSYTQWYKESTQGQRWTEYESQAAPAAVCSTLQLPSGCTVNAVVSRVGQLSGVPALTLSTIWKVSDTLYCRAQHSYPIFPWAAGPVLDYLMQLSAWTMYQMFNSPTARRLTGGPLIKQFLANAHAKYDATSGMLNETQNDAAKKRLILYSAHDTTVAALLMALDEEHFGISYAPPYASAVIVELWDEGSIETAFFRFRFQHNVNTNVASGPEMMSIMNLTVPGCPNFDCPIETFASAMANIIPVDWTKECKLPSMLSRVVSSLSGGSIAAIVIGVICGIVALVGIFKIRQARKQKYEYAARHAYNLVDPHDEEL